MYYTYRILGDYFDHVSIEIIINIITLVDTYTVLPTIRIIISCKWNLVSFLVKIVGSIRFVASLFDELCIKFYCFNFWKLMEREGLVNANCFCNTKRTCADCNLIYSRLRNRYPRAPKNATSGLSHMEHSKKCCKYQENYYCSDADPSEFFLIVINLIGKRIRRNFHKCS